MFSQSSFDNIKVITLDTVLKGSHKQKIVNLDFYDNKKLLTASSDGVVKIWDLDEQDLIKSLQIGSGFKKAVFSSDGKKIYILTQKRFSILDAYSFKELNYIEGVSFEDFVICDSLNSVIISKYYDSVISYNLNNGDKNYNISTRQYTTHMDISKNNKYFLIADRTNVYVHNSKTGVGLIKIVN